MGGLTRGFHVLLFVSFIVLHDVSFGQNKDSTAQKKNIFQRMDSISNWKIEQGKATLTPFVAPSYTPETNAMLTAGGLFTFSLNPSDKLLSRSSIPFSIGYSVNGSLNTSVRANIYGLHDKLRIGAEWWHKNMPDNYWGIGYEDARNNPLSDSTTAYQRNWMNLKFNVVYEVFTSIYVGLNYDFNRTIASEVNPVMAEDPNYLEFGDTILNSGFGLVLRYDTRDFPENAYSGIFLDLSGTAYGKHFDDANVFHVITFDYRQYQALKRNGRTLTWQLKTSYSNGDVPWPNMSMIGTPFDLRGYRWGQYRDLSSIFILTEYRHMFGRKKPNSRGDMYGPLGFVVWTGTGSVTPTWGEFNNWIPNAGVGLRFELLKRMNLRIDYGVGYDSSAFYFSFNEVF